MVPSFRGDGGGALEAVATLRSMFGETAPKSAGASRASTSPAPSSRVDAMPSSRAAGGGKPSRRFPRRRSSRSAGPARARDGHDAGRWGTHRRGLLKCLRAWACVADR
jgi:hypothetical protein